MADDAAKHKNRCEDASEELNFAEVSDDISDVSWREIPVMVIFWSLFGIVSLQFFTRYVLNDSIGWSEEIARYFLIFLTFVGSVTCVAQGSHIFLEFFYRYLPLQAIKPLAICVDGVSMVFYAVGGYFCILLAEQTAHQYMASVHLPKGIIYWTVTVCFFAMALASLYRMILKARSNNEKIIAEITNSAIAG